MGKEESTRSTAAMSALLGFCHRCWEYSRDTWTPQYLSMSWKDRRRKAESAFFPRCQSASKETGFFRTPESWQLEQNPWWDRTGDSAPPDTSEHASPWRSCPQLTNSQKEKHLGWPNSCQTLLLGHKQSQETWTGCRRTGRASSKTQPWWLRSVSLAIWAWVRHPTGTGKPLNCRVSPS